MSNVNMNTCGVYVNLDQIRDLVREFLVIRHIPIRDLERKHPAAKRKFDQFLQLVEKVKHSDAYDEIFKIVERETRGFNSIQPGTLGSYFKGCLLPVSFPDNPSCSEICASSFQPPHTIDGWYTCGKLVIRAKWNSEGNFSTEIICKGSPEGNNPGYLLIDHTTLSEFPGFSMREKKELRDLGLTSCKLLSVSVTGKEYRELIGGFQSIDNLPSRVSRQEVDNNSSNNQTKNPWIAMFFFLLVLVGVGIFSLMQLSSEQE